MLLHAQPPRQARAQRGALFADYLHIEYGFREPFGPKLAPDIGMRQHIDRACDKQLREALRADAHGFALVDERRAGMRQSVGDGGRLAVIERRSRRADDQLLEIRGCVVVERKDADDTGGGELVQPVEGLTAAAAPRLELAAPGC